MTLIDFGASGGGGKKGTVRGDAVLSLLLFEADSYDTMSRGDGLLPEKIYKGGSRGAFETMAKLREGTVIALLNPRVLKPLQVSVIFAYKCPQLGVLWPPLKPGFIFSPFGI
jgi:minichromosome maintenance protein 10